MTRARSRRGCTIVAPLVGATLGLAVLAGLTVALVQATRWVVRANRRAEVHDTADLVTQAFGFDVRASGWDPAGSSGARLVYAAPAAIEIHVDRDGDGVIDVASAERVRWQWLPASTALRRIVGNQPMPIASTVAGAAFEYRDATGMPLPVPASGLMASDLAHVRTVGLAFVVASADGGPAVERVAAISLRGGTP